MIAPCSVNALGKTGENLSLAEVVANCDHLSLFLFRKLEHKTFGESAAIAFNLLIQPLRNLGDVAQFFHLFLNIKISVPLTFQLLRSPFPQPKLADIFPTYPAPF
jgi:hypothetical protein